MLRGSGTGGSDVLRGGGIGDRPASNTCDLKLSEELRDGGGASKPVCRLRNVGTRLKDDTRPTSVNDGKLVLNLDTVVNGLASDGKLRVDLVKYLKPSANALMAAVAGPPPFCIKYLRLLANEYVGCTT